MKFSVFQVSRKGGREKNEDRMGYCYTRESGLFVLADGMGGHPEGEVGAQLALQTLAALFQREASRRCRTRCASCTTAMCRRTTRSCATRPQKALLDTPRTTLVACLVQGNAAYWAHCGDSRLYLVRGGKLIARTRDHSYSELQQTMRQVVPMGDRINRNMLFTCLGARPSRWSTPSARCCCSRATGSCCAPTACGARVERQRDRRPAGAAAVSDAVPELVEQALRNGGAEERQRHRARGRMGAPRTTTSTRGISTAALGDGVFASTIQAGVLGTDCADDLDDAEIERSIAEINEAIKRSSSPRRLNALRCERPLASPTSYRHAPSRRPLQRRSP